MVAGARVNRIMDKSKSEPKKAAKAAPGDTAVSKRKEVGGPKGLEPTRYGDWERKGIASDF